MLCRPLMCICCNFVFKQRYVMILMLHLALFNAYILRIVYNLAITEMTTEKNETNIHDECPQYKYEAVVKGVTRQWENQLHSLTLYSFYIGYIVSHVPGGWMADKIGARPVMAVCMFTAIVANLVLPVFVQNFGDGSIAAVVLRAILGLAQGPMIPCVSTFIQKWVPSEERGFLGGIAFGGANLGTVVGGTLTGTMIQQSRNWTLPFYIWGIVALVWFMFYLIWVFSTPKSHPFITDEELEFLETNVTTKAKFKVPWLKILASPPCWALLAGQFGHSFIVFTLFTYLPIYMKDILKLNIQSNAIFTALPFLMLWISTILFAFLTDFITNRKIISVRVARVLYTTIAAVVPGIFLLIVVYIGCNRVLVILFYTLALIFVGPFFSGMKVNVNDLTKHYGGTIMAFVNGLGSTAGIIGPYVTGYFTKDKTLRSWSIVFWIVFIVSVVTSLFYIIFAKVDRQDWDNIKQEENVTS